MSDISAIVVVESTEHNCLQYYTSSIKIGNKEYFSTDSVFGQGTKSERSAPFTVGLHNLVDQGFWYETEDHSKLALLMVVSKDLDPTFVERHFLPSGNFTIVFPESPHARDYHGGNTKPLRLPMVAMVRQSGFVLAIDIEFLRYRDFYDLEVIDVTESCGKWLALNRHHGYYDANENWTAHPNETLCRLQAMKKRISSRPGIRACFSVLGKTDFHIFKLPNKTVSFQVGGALGLEAGWSIVTVRHNFNNNRTDKVCICSFRYNFAPIS